MTEKAAAIKSKIKICDEMFDDLVSFKNDTSFSSIARARVNSCLDYVCKIRESLVSDFGAEMLKEEV
jgi:hypothetical protein